MLARCLEDQRLGVRPRASTMRRWLSICCQVLGLAIIGGLVGETWRLAELAGRYEGEARAAQKAAAAAAIASARPLFPVPPVTTDTAAVARLEAELVASQAQVKAMTETLQQHNEVIARTSAEAEAAAARSSAPIPEGVRLSLQALHECLRAEGFVGQRFLSARRLDGDGLHEVELLDADADGLGVVFVRADRMTAELDRGTGRLVLKLFDGFRTAGGERLKLPEDGWQIVFASVDGRRFEERLPLLIRADGVYPERDPGAGRKTTDVDPITRRQWLERFDHLLAMAATQHRLRVSRFRGMQDGWFLTAEVVGTDDRLRLLSSAHCARLAIEVDQTAGVVSLLLQDGALRSGGVESTITAEGYRMLLPSVTCKQATDAMFGMVVSK